MGDLCFTIGRIGSESLLPFGMVGYYPTIPPFVSAREGRAQLQSVLVSEGAPIGHLDQEGQVALESLAGIFLAPTVADENHLARVGTLHESRALAQKMLRPLELGPHMIHRYRFSCHFFFPLLLGNIPHSFFKDTNIIVNIFGSPGLNVIAPRKGRLYHSSTITAKMLMGSRFNSELIHLSLY